MMRKLYIYHFFLLIFFFQINLANSSEQDVYKKIDIFSEVLDKINKEFVDEVNQSEAMD
jgi:carboxyl-terminal processing protease